MNGQGKGEKREREREGITENDYFKRLCTIIIIGDQKALQLDWLKKNQTLEKKNYFLLFSFFFFKKKHFFFSLVYCCLLQIFSSLTSFIFTLSFLSIIYSNCSISVYNTVQLLLFFCCQQNAKFNRHRHGERVVLQIIWMTILNNSH